MTNAIMQAITNSMTSWRKAVSFLMADLKPNIEYLAALITRRNPVAFSIIKFRRYIILHNHNSSGVGIVVLVKPKHPYPQVHQGHQ